MNWNKLLIGSLFAIMALGGMGGMMLVGYSPPRTLLFSS